MKPRVIHLLPQDDTLGAVTQSKQVARALDDEFESIHIRLGSDLPWRGGLELAGWRALRTFFEREQPAVIHFWLAADDLWPIAIIPKHVRARRIASWRAWEPGIDGKLRRWLSRRLDRIVVPTSGLAQRFQAQGFDAQRMVVVPQRLDAPLVRQEARSSFLARHGLSPEIRIVVAVGRWRWSDRWKDVIWSKDICKVLRDDVCLVLFDHGHDVWRLERYNALVTNGGQIRFLPIDELSRWLPQADVFLSARDDAGVSPELLAAAHCGVPILASQTACHQQLFTHERDAMLFPIGNRAELVRLLARMLDEPVLAAGLQAAAAVKVREAHDPKAITAQYSAIYRGR